MLETINILKHQWSDMRIISELKNNDTLYNYVIENCAIASSYCDEINNFFDEYTDHSSNHSFAVLMNGNKLSENIPLNEVEVAIFVLSCYYHDIGMCVSNGDIEKYKNTKDFAIEKEYLIDKIAIRNSLDNSRITPEIIDKFIMLEYIRERHHNFSRDWIENKFNKSIDKSYVNIQSKNEYIWGYVAKICEAHCLDLNEINDLNYPIISIANKDVNLMFLACLLRMSDYCHIGRDRALPYVRTCKDFYSKYSKSIWEKLDSVDSVRFEKKNFRINIHAECDDSNVQHALIKEAISMDKELHAQNKHLAKYKSDYQYSYFFIDYSQIKEAPSASYVYSPTGFKMNYNKITNLLIGSKLYEHNFYALREAIQNSVDAVSVQSIGNSTFIPYILINYYTMYDSSMVLEIFDNGTGMDMNICKNHFLSIGDSSYWNSKQCYDNFGNVKEGASIISSHGIGVLSYFLLSDEIELFSKFRDCEPIHMQINSFNQNVLFLKTNMKDYPKFNQSLYGFDTPWQQGHGTCVRLKLKEKFWLENIIQFLSLHILRTRCNIYFINELQEIAELPKVHFPLEAQKVFRDNDIKHYVDNFSHLDVKESDFSKENFDKLLDSLEHTGLSIGEMVMYSESTSVFKKQGIDIYDDYIKGSEHNGVKLSLSEQCQKFYKDATYDFYNASIEDLVVHEINFEGINGKIYLEKDLNKLVHNRVSQNGIWIKNGYRFLDKVIISKIGRSNEIFSYDIDCSVKLFDLTAS